MTKETKKAVAKSKIKNPLLADNEDEQINEETDLSQSDIDTEEEVVEKPKAKVIDKAPTVNASDGLNSDIRATKQKLDSEAKVRFFVPLFEGEKVGSVHDCFINGYKYSVKKGVMTDIPETIATLLADHYKITEEAGKDYRVDENDKKQDALA